MSNFLNTLRPKVLERVKTIELQDRNKNHSQGIDFLDIFHNKEPVIIAEIKFSSPSLGRIYPGNLDPVAIAGSYLKNGASALSILTEPEYFKGNIDYIKAVRKAYPSCPILLKDFVLDKKQILQAKEFGANAILLIVAFLEFNELQDLYHFTLDQGLTPLIEIHDSKELNLIKPLKPKLIGINNRSLNSLEIDLEISRNLINQIEKPIHTVCESGIENAQTMAEMEEIGFNGFLIGSTFMKSVDPGVGLGEFLKKIE